MTSPSHSEWISRSIVSVAAVATLVSNPTSCVWEGESASLEVRNESRNLCCFKSVASGGDGIIDEGEFALELQELVSKASAVVIIAAVSFDLGNCIPVVKVRYCLA